MDNSRFIELAREKVAEYANEYSVHRLGTVVTKDDVFVVWSCKTLQNHKAILSTTLRDQRIYEVTYNGDKCELYLDAYKKEQNSCFMEIE